MLKKRLFMLIVTSFVILIPMIVGLFLWNSLPESVAVHWNVQGVADGFAGKGVAVFALPAFLLAIHWICTAVTCADPKMKEGNAKSFGLVLWICPLISLLMGSVVYSIALGYDLSIEIIVPLVLGALFVVIGNYLPKVAQNYTVGIKLPWTLNDRENWNKTHRFAGILWVIGGVGIMAGAFLGSLVLFLSVVIVLVLVPAVYSYCLYRKKK